MNIIKYTKKGNYHIENQDYIDSYETDDYRMIILADGVSSCDKGKEAAKLVCDSVKCALELYGKDFFDFSEKKLATALNRHIHYYLKHNVDENDLSKYDTTLSFVVIDKKYNQILCVNLGDGLICGIHNQDIQCLMQPKRIFNRPCTILTKNGIERGMDIQKYQGFDYDSLFICSDGVFDYLSLDSIKRALKNLNFKEISNLLNTVNNQDDCSFIAINSN